MPQLLPTVICVDERFNHAGGGNLTLLYVDDDNSLQDAVVKHNVHVSSQEAAVSR